MYNEFLQNLVCEIYRAIEKNVGVIDNKSNVIAFSDPKKIDFLQDIVHKEFKSSHLNIFTFNVYSCMPVRIAKGETCYVFIEGAEEENEGYIKMINIMLSNMHKKLDGYYEKEFFVKKVLLEGLYENDVEIKAKALNIDLDVKRLVLVVRFLENKNPLSAKLLEEFLNKGEKSFVFQVDVNSLVLIKNIKEGFNDRKILVFANQIINKMASEFSLNVNIGIGSVAQSLKDIANSFKEARMCLDIKSIFKNLGNVVCFNSLGLTRLIYKLPMDVCEDFLSEVLEKETIEKLDDELIRTMSSFFENNLNISETSRKLFIHRNTLIYRLDKIRNLTGLDLRIFEEAIIFKLAIMVQKYLDFAN